LFGLSATFHSMAYRGLDRKYGFLIWLELSYCSFIEDIKETDT